MGQKSDNEEENEEENEDAIHTTIVAKNIVQALRLSYKNIDICESKIKEGKQLSQDELDQLQADVNVAMYASMLFSEDTKSKKDKNRKTK